MRLNDLSFPLSTHHLQYSAGVKALVVLVMEKTLEESPPPVFLASGLPCPAAPQVNHLQNAPPRQSRLPVVVRSLLLVHSSGEGQLLEGNNEKETK